MNGQNYRELYQKALAEGRNRNYPKALMLLRTVVAETDTMPRALLYLGRTYHALNNFDKAVQAYKNYIAVCPGESAGYFFLGRTYLAMDFPDHAVYYLKQAFRLNRNESPIYGLLGLAYLRSKNPKAAMAVFEEAVQKFPQDKQLYTGYLNTLTVQAVKLFQIGDYDLSGQMFEFVEQQGHASVFSHIYLAMIERERGEYKNSLHYFNKAISASPNDHLLKLSRTNLLFAMGEQEAAMREFQELKQFFPNLKAMRVQPKEMNRFLAVQFFQNQEYRKAIFYAKRVLHSEKDPDMHMLLGESFRIVGETEKAENHFNRVLDRNRNRVEARYGKIIIYWNKKRYSDILREIDRIESVDPGNSVTSYYKILCRSRLKQTSSITIQEIIDEIRKQGPDIHLFNILGDEYINEGLQDLAEKWFKKTLKLDSENREAMRGLVRTYKLLKNRDKLVAAYKHYLEMYPGDGKMRRAFIDYCVEVNDYKTAVEEIIAYIPLKKKDNKLQRLLAYCYRQTSEFREAAIIYRNLLRKEPANKEYLRGLIFCLNKIGETSKAIELLSKAFDFIKPTPSLLLIHGVLLYQNRDTENALKVFRNVIDLDRTDWRAYKNIGIIYREKGIHSMADKFLSHAKKYKAAVPINTQKRER